MLTSSPFFIDPRLSDNGRIAYFFPSLRPNPGTMKREFFYIFLVICFCLGAFFKQFDLFYPKPFVLVAFCGAIGLLIDYAWRIRRNLFWIVPAFLACELIGDLINAAGFREAAKIPYIPGALVFMAFGVLFIRSGLKQLPREKGLAAKFVMLGLVAISLTLHEAVTYFPQDYDPSNILFRGLYLLCFACLIFVDVTTDFSKFPQLKVEKQILRVSLIVIAVMYFVRFIFK